MCTGASSIFFGVDEIFLEKYDEIHVNRSSEPNHAQDLNFTSIQLVIYFLKSSYLTHHYLWFIKYESFAYILTNDSMNSSGQHIIRTKNAMLKEVTVKMTMSDSSRT